ncbi:MAG: hypothetical protein PF447_07865 [Spirochaetaceae bacterium]|jgi:hypothetical protein|nr:hypothetical protein [Spirochaetaceae bacterium]
MKKHNPWTGTNNPHEPENLMMDLIGGFPNSLETRLVLSLYVEERRSKKREERGREAI